jgi:Ca-activated chloride channel homolog
MAIACGAMLLIANHSRPSRGQMEKQNASCQSRPVIARDIPVRLAPADLPVPAAGDIIRKNVEEVRVVFSVLDRQGRFVDDMTPSDVELKDDDRIIDELTGFSRSANLPLRLALLVDVSESMTREFGQEQQAAGDFLRNVVRPEYDQAFVLTFATRVDPKQRYLHEAHVEKLKMHAQSGGQTALYDAICSACLDELMHAQENSPVRRVIVLLSDGEDTQSRHSLPDAVEWAQRAGVAVYAVTVHNGRGEFPGDRVLKDLAAASGGRAFILKSYDQLPSIFTEIEGELRAQYVVTYRRSVAPPRSGFHRLQVTLRNHPGMKVNYRRGYFAATTFGE